MEQCKTCSMYIGIIEWLSFKFDQKIIEICHFGKCLKCTQIFSWLPYLDHRTFMSQLHLCKILLRRDLLKWSFVNLLVIKYVVVDM